MAEPVATPSRSHQAEPIVAVPRRGRPGYDRDGLLRVAVEVFNERGYDGTSMEDLAGRLGITKSSIYHHVAGQGRAAPARGRPGAGRAVRGHRRARGQHRPGHRPARARGAAQRRGAGRRAAVRDAAAAGARQHGGGAGRAAPPARASTGWSSELVAEAEAAGDVRPDVDPALASRLLFGLVNSLTEWYRPDGGLTGRTSPTPSSRIAFGGLRARPAPGRREINTHRVAVTRERSPGRGGGPPAEVARRRARRAAPPDHRRGRRRRCSGTRCRRAGRRRRRPAGRCDEGAELVVVWGGDGMVQRCVDALAGSGRAGRRSSRPAPPTCSPATSASRRGPGRRRSGSPSTARRRALDLGRVNGEHFAVMAGVGFDADMIDGRRPRREGPARQARVRPGRPAARPTAPTAGCGSRWTATRWFGGDASCVLLGNVGKITGGIPAFDDAEPDDGWLEVGVATASGALQWARTLGRMAVGRSDQLALHPHHPGPQGRTSRLSAPTRYELDGGAREPVTRSRPGSCPARSRSACRTGAPDHTPESSALATA